MFDWLTPQVIDVIIAVAKGIVCLLALMTVAALMIWYERRMLALWQDRYGPNRLGPLGVGQVAADMIKIFFKEDWTPPFADKFTFWLAPMLAMALILLSFALIPLAPSWGVSDLNLGLLFFLALAGLGVYAVMLGGWASNSKYSLMGAIRSTAQTVSYEVFMGIAVLGVVMQADSFNLRAIVDAQQGMWNIVPQFLGFWLFALAAVASVHRTPFDLPEAEAELAAGYHTEYSGMKFGMFMVGEYVGIVVVSALLVVLYFGGWHGPFSFIPPFAWFAIKTLFFMTLFILLRGALPRPRYDHLMSAGWKVCLPLALLNTLVTGAIIVAQTSGG
jgi:NADH-quinone oxidoreductase subunit H